VEALVHLALGKLSVATATKILEKNVMIIILTGLTAVILQEIILTRMVCVP
jgi:hypothetical protein